MRGWQFPRETFRPEDIDKDREFYNEVHYQGFPILVADQTPRQRAHRAVAAYGKFYALGFLPGQPDRKIVSVGQGVGAGTWGPNEILQRLDEAVEFGGKHGEAAKFLVYGPPFPKPQGRFRFLPNWPYRAPGWDTVKRNAFKFHLDQFHTMDYPMLRTKLKEMNMITTELNGKLHGFKLARDGSVLFHDFGLIR